MLIQQRCEKRHALLNTKPSSFRVAQQQRTTFFKKIIFNLVSTAYQYQHCHTHSKFSDAILSALLPDTSFYDLVCL